MIPSPTFWPDSELHTFDILSAPSGAVQSTGILVPLKALIISYGIYTQVLEDAGSQGFLNIGFLNSSGQWFTKTGVDARSWGSGHSSLTYFSLSQLPGVSGELVFQASSSDWVEYRGRIYIIWSQVVPPGFGL